MTLKPIHYQLHLFGDLHVGSGVGLPGVIDEYVVRDQDNFPQVLGSEIKGIVRDNCVRLLKYSGRWDSICQGQRGWHDKMTILMEGVEVNTFCGLQGKTLCILCALFGSPATPGGWWFSPATYAEDYRDMVERADPKGQLRLAYRDMAINAQASIDPETKRAEEDHLFNLEVIRTSQVWEGYIEPVLLPSGQPKPAAEENELLGWLTGALLFTRRLGGRRRRGWGRCRFDLSDTSIPGNVEAINALENLLRRMANG